MSLRTADFDYELPERLIAQTPSPNRAESRLLTVNRGTGHFAHHKFRDLLELLHPGDLLVLNQSRVLPARLRAARADSGSELEVLLLNEVATNEWWCMAKPAKRLREDRCVTLLDSNGLPTDATVHLIARNEDGHCHVRFEGVGDIRELLPQIGQLPLPPYIERSGTKLTPEDWERYQTVYAGPEGSVAAPTAGLHFTHDFLGDAQRNGIGVAKVTLHVGVGTFAPVKAEHLHEHRMHEETYDIAPEAAEAINAAKARGSRVIAVGTTSVRTIESVARANGGRIVPGQGSTKIFIHPPAQFVMTDALLTNFHLPKSTLLMLVSAFASPEDDKGRELMMRAYGEAIREEYRFFSYGDAMFIH